jgi:CRP/FNR family transcriptional regulator, anaerobic regulatory protein
MPAMTSVAKSILPVPVPVEAPAACVAGVDSLAPVLSICTFKAHCQTCSLRELCLPAAFTSDEIKQFDALVAERTRLKCHDSLYRAGDPFYALYAIRSGSLKTIVIGEDGREQVTGYHMLGEIVGFDGIGTDRHGVEAVALEDTEACLLPFTRIENLARTMPVLQHNLHQMMSAEITRNHSVMLMLGSMHAKERLALFLLNLADRYRCRGYSSTEYVLRMTREEIGSFVGLKLETVSRVLSRFHQQGLIHVQGRAVKLIDRVGLKQIVGQRD